MPQICDEESNANSAPDRGSEVLKPSSVTSQGGRRSISLRSTLQGLGLTRRSVKMAKCWTSWRWRNSVVSRSIMASR